MSLFAVLLPKENPELVKIIKEKFPEHYEITPTQWIISAKGTVKQVSDNVGVSLRGKSDRLSCRPMNW